MPYDESLVERVRKKLSRRKSVEEKKMFGGLGFLLNGNMLAAGNQSSRCSALQRVLSFILVLRLAPPQHQTVLLQRVIGRVEEHDGTLLGRSKFTVRRDSRRLNELADLLPKRRHRQLAVGNVLRIQHGLILA